jgi:hypothetical protein
MSAENHATPVTTAELERCLSRMKRIKIFLWSTVPEACMSTLAVLTAGKNLLELSSNFKEKVIE